MKHHLLPPMLLLAVGLFACHTSPVPARPQLPTSRPDATGAAPIDCPLHKAGVDASGLRPFEEVEEYIAFLERPDRASWQRPNAVVGALHLKGDETVTDVGAGSGYFSFPLAAALPDGVVRAVDIEPEMIRHIHHRVLDQGIQNLQAVLATPDDPQVEADTDLVFMCDVLHHVADREIWLARLSPADLEKAS